MGVALQQFVKKYEKAELALFEQALMDALVAVATDYVPAAYQSEVVALENLVLPVVKQWLGDLTAKIG